MACNRARRPLHRHDHYTASGLSKQHVAYAQFLLDEECAAASRDEAAQAVYTLLQSLGESEAAWRSVDGAVPPPTFIVFPPRLRSGSFDAVYASLLVFPPKSALHILPRFTLRNELADRVTMTAKLHYLPPGQSRPLTVWAGSTAALVLHGLLEEAGLAPNRIQRRQAGFALARLLAPICAVLDTRRVRIAIGRRRMQRLLRAAKQRLASTPEGQAIFELLAPYGVRSGPLWQRALRGWRANLQGVHDHDQ